MINSDEQKANKNKMKPNEGKKFLRKQRMKKTNERTQRESRAQKSEKKKKKKKIISAMMT